MEGEPKPRMIIKTEADRLRFKHESAPDMDSNGEPIEVSADAIPGPSQIELENHIV